MQVVRKVRLGLRGAWCLVAAAGIGVTSIAVVVPVATSDVAAAGAPDPLFGDGGYVEVGGEFRRPGKLAVGPANEVVVVMPSSTVAGGVFDKPLLRVERMFADGTRDPGFGTNGVAEIELRPGLRNVSVQDIHVLSGGRTLALVGTTAETPPNVPNQLVMIDSTGQLDSSFGDGGVFTPEYDPGDCSSWKSMQAFAVGVNGTISVRAIELCGIANNNPRHIGLLSDAGVMIDTFGNEG